MPCDFLTVASGLTPDWGSIKGFELSMVGKDGIGAVHAGPDHAEATWREMDAFPDKGGIGLLGRPATEMKCAGAPLRYALITDDCLRRKGTRDRSQVIHARKTRSSSACRS